MSATDGPAGQYRLIARVGASARAGHHHVHRLLDMFARQLRAFGQGWTPDMALMRDILGCLNRYTAVGSDAYESRMMDELTRSNCNFAPARLVLITEHDVIGELGRHCLALVDGIIGGSIFERSELVSPGQRYLRMYRAYRVPRPVNSW